MELETVNVQAPSKLNLALSVGQADAQGMHPICSWMVTVDLFDDLTLTQLLPDRLSRYAIIWHKDAKRRSDINWSITSDLAVRAHLALEKHAGRRLPLQLKLEKRIPVGGGLGGGSSDAATMLRAVNDLFQLDVSEADLLKIAGLLGSDVPFFMHGGSAIVEGLGERIERHQQLPELDVIVAFPDASCCTADAYTAYDALDGGPVDATSVRDLAEKANSGTPIAASLFNDLAPCALHLAPSLEDDQQRLGELAERPAYITGSGSSLFVICDNSLHAEVLAEAVEERLALPCVAARVHRSPVRLPK